MDLDLAGRVAVVTGGGSGIGLAVVERLLGEGVSVEAGDPSVPSLQDLAKLADRVVCP